jgi:hypothetical protein
VAKLTVTLSALVLLLGACASHKRPTSPDSGGLRDGGGGTDSSGFGNPGQAGSSSGAGSAASGGSSSDPGADGGATSPDAATASDPLMLCGGACQCSDGIDNDGDGVTDGFDSECTGASDDDEGSFATGIPGDNVDPKWQDCFFDGNSGGGDDHCRYSTDCLTGKLPQDDAKCTVTQQCIDFCKPRTPNGCDCFGCCTFTLADGGTKSVVLSASCEEGTWDGCTECVPTTDCVNKCGTCELCPGKTVADLPAECSTTPPPPTAGSGGNGGSGGVGGSSGTGGSTPPPPPPYTCDDGEQVCVQTTDCPSVYYCSFGCCQPIVF